VSTLSAAQPYIRSGKLKAYGVTSAKPSELAPGLPALGQVKGLEGFDLGVWFGLFLPVKTSPEIARKLEAATRQVMADAAVRKKLADLGLSASGESSDALRKFMAAEVEKYQAVVKAAKITAE
jgi:tripartite-type tricarboxylate transporter receptor subunit TctC